MPTREGLVVLILAVAVFLLATNLMSGLLFVLDALLVALLLVGAATAHLPMHRMRVRRHVPSRGVEGMPVPIRVELSAARGGRFLVIEDGPQGMRARTPLAYLPFGRPATVTVHPIPRRRGQYVLGPVEVTSRGTVGLLAVRRRFDLRDRITVWPRVAPVPDAVRLRLTPAIDGQATAMRTRQPEDFYGVRDYQPTDSPSRIHWKSSARRGALVVREYERPTRSVPALVVDLDRRQSAARLDAAVRAAASLLRTMLDQRPDAVTLGWEPQPVEHRGWETTMDWLAGATPSGPPLQDALSEPGPHAGRALIIVASTAGLPPLAQDALVILPAEEAPATCEIVYTSEGRVQSWQAGAI
jgi:uncharacterized protein (DUF58 family)